VEGEAWEGGRRPATCDVTAWGLLLRAQVTGSRNVGGEAGAAVRMQVQYVAKVSHNMQLHIKHLKVMTHSNWQHSAGTQQTTAGTGGGTCAKPCACWHMVVGLRGAHCKVEKLLAISAQLGPHTTGTGDLGLKHLV
jgi:hypothetical protein